MHLARFGWLLQHRHQQIAPLLSVQQRDQSGNAQRKGEPFTKTFIYGSYDGTFIFGEPMVAKAYLETKPATAVLPQR